MEGPGALKTYDGRAFSRNVAGPGRYVSNTCHRQTIGNLNRGYWSVSLPPPASTARYRGEQLHRPDSAGMRMRLEPGRRRAVPLHEKGIEPIKKEDHT
jgi:hypothetical protein